MRGTLGVVLSLIVAVTPAFPGGGGGCECGELACCGQPQCCVTPNLSFECGDLTDWTASGDVAVLSLDPCLQPQMPSDDCFAACLSTEDLFGGQATGGVRSDLITPGFDVDFRPASVIVEFDFDYGTDETVQDPFFNDTIDVTLLTAAGPFPLIVADTWGVAPEGGRVKRVEGQPFFTLPNPGCPVAAQTGRISVRTKAKIPSSLQRLVRTQQVFVQFSVSDRSGASGLTFACIDNVNVKIKKRN